jgi:hypothetical protein
MISQEAQPQLSPERPSALRASVDLVFEDANLRILMVTMPPGSRTKRIAYNFDYAVLPLNDGMLTRVVYDGANSHREHHVMKAGAGYLRSASAKPVDHYFINETRHEIRFQKVEFTISRLVLN